MPQRILFPQADDILFAPASKHVIVTVERIISNALVRRNTNMVQLHKHKVTAVVLAPYGAHPCSFPQFYNVDDAHMRQYMEASRSQEGMDSYLDTSVRGIPDHYAYPGYDGFAPAERHQPSHVYLSLKRYDWRM